MGLDDKTKMKVTDYLRGRLLAETEADTTIIPVIDSLDELRATEWSSEFEQLMRNRLVMGAFRYGKLSAPNKHRYNRVKSIRARLELYREDGNTEHLVDIANLALCEFVEGDHPKKHFRSTDGGEHIERNG